MTAAERPAGAGAGAGAGAARRTARTPAVRRQKTGALAVRVVLLCVLPAIAALAALSALGAALDTGALPVQAAAIGWLLAWLLGSAWLAWSAWEAWPATATRGRTGKALMLRLALRALVLLTALVWLARLALDAAPVAAERLQLALGRDPAGQLQLLPSADGKRLRLQGPIGLGDGRRVQKQLVVQPALQLLELQAGGTRLAEARSIAQAVRQRSLQTRMVGACDNACVMVWLAGSGRQVMAAGQLGLHRPRTHVLDPLGVSLVRSGWAAAWRDAGLPDDFTQRGLRTPPGTPWSPDAAQLQASALLDVPGWPLDVALPRGPGATQADHAEALLSHHLWRALQARYPGSVDMAAERIAALQGGVPADALQVAAQDVVQALLPAVLAGADTWLHEQYTALLAEQLAAAQAAGGDRCTLLLQADAATRRALPQPLRQREAAWLQDALASAPQALPEQRRSDLEREVMRRTLGDRAPALLATLWGPRRTWGPDPGCQRAAQLLAAVAQLPPAERKLAARLMYQSR